ncbi:MAG: TIM barrel protein [Thermoleophilaceae bacterium]|nr:TIM barrel protein [Thermoleophilaceae bacterium]
MTQEIGGELPREHGAGPVVVANAPVSYGAFEITVGSYPNVPDPITLLDAVASAGYEGIDLGPVGYLGTGEELAERLGSRNLSLAGGYLGLPFSEPERLAEELPSLDALLDVFDSVPDGRVKARPTLADAGSPERAAYPGRAALDHSVGLDEKGWRNFADGLARAVERCRERGYEPTFHHHTATYIEAMWEIERLLELSDVGVTLDTGHLLLGRGDPVKAVRDWRERINHVHLKDARQDVLDAIVADRAPVMDIWTRKAFCRFGEGDVAIDEVLAALRDIGYSGWLVVEQDMIPREDEPVELAAAEQAQNREYLRERGL